MRLAGVLLAVLAGLAAMPAGAGAATTFQVKPGVKSLYVRNAPGAFVIGTIYAGQQIDVQRKARRGFWGYGLVRGSFPTWQGRRCGWVRLRGTTTAGARGVPGTCPASPPLLAEGALFKAGTFIPSAGAGSVLAANRKACADPRVFGNYDPGTGGFSNPYGISPPTRGANVPGYGQRYVTADGRATLIKDTSNLLGAPAWHFMRSECIDRISSYIGQIDNAPGAYFPFSNHLRRPTRLDSYRGDYTISRIHWRSWGGSSVRGRGRFALALCEQTCATRRRIRRRANLTLDRRRAGVCQGKPAAFYTRLTVSYRLIDEREPSGFRVRRNGERFTLDPACNIRTGRDLTPP